MNCIQHLIEPTRLWLVWQPSETRSERRTCRIVAEIVQSNQEVSLRYLHDTVDFTMACAEGFTGYPGFKLAEREHTQGILQAFLRRLPPRKREDFGEYLAMHRLPENFSGSDMALLGYTGAKLPGDGFELVPDLALIEPPLEIVLEVAGFRHQDTMISDIKVGDAIALASETDNPVDAQSIAILHNGRRIGYVGRPYLPVFHRWMQSQRIEAIIERVNGRPDRPLVYLFVIVR